MLRDIHDTIRVLLYNTGGLDPLEVDVRFESPTSRFLDRLTRPTISFFLFDLHENTDLRRNSFQSTQSNGHSERRLAPRRIDLYYMVSVLTTEVADEHLLLWRVLATLMKHHELPEEVLSDEIKNTGIPVVTRAGQPDDAGRVIELWNGLGHEPRPSIVYVVTAPLDLDVVVSAPLVLTRTARFSGVGSSSQDRSGNHIGGVVRDAEGQPLPGVCVSIDGRRGDGTYTNDSGQFVLSHVPYGSLTLSVAKPDGTVASAEFDVPADSYDIIVD